MELNGQLHTIREPKLSLFQEHEKTTSIQRIIYYSLFFFSGITGSVKKNPNDSNSLISIM